MPVFSAPPLINTHASMGATAVVDYSLLVTLHLDTLSVVDSKPKDPWFQSTQAKNCLVSVPNGATYLDIYHIWASNATGPTSMTTRPKIRVFGEVPIVKGNDYVADPIYNMGANAKSRPFDTGLSNWIPLPNQANLSEYLMDVGNTSDHEPLAFPSGAAGAAANGQSMSVPVTVLLKGVRRVVVTLSSVCVPQTSGNLSGVPVLAGAFGFTLHS